MKKLVLLAAAAALVVPAAASAKDYKHDKKAEKESNYTYKKVETKADGEYRIEMQSEDDFITKTGNRSQQFSVVDDTHTATGEKLQLDRDTVYKVTPSGERFFAPNGAYKTSGNQTIVVEDAQLVRIENTPEVFVLDLDNDGRRS